MTVTRGSFRFSDAPMQGFEPELVWPSSTFHLRSLPLVFPATNRVPSNSN